jgi:hypothetical protein
MGAGAVEARQAEKLVSFVFVWTISRKILANSPLDRSSIWFQPGGGAMSLVNHCFQSSINSRSFGFVSPIFRPYF